MTDEEFLEMIQSLPVIETEVIECRAYYDDAGKILTYTTEKMPGDYIIITPNQYAEARHDALVIDGQLVLNNHRTHVSKLSKNRGGGIKTSKYDVSVIVSDGESSYYTIRAYEIKR